MKKIDFNRKPNEDNAKSVISNAKTYLNILRNFIFNHSLWGIFAVFVVGVVLLVFDIQHFNSVQPNTGRIDEIIKENKIPKIDSKTIEDVLKLKDTPSGDVGPPPTVNSRANPFGE